MGFSGDLHGIGLSDVFQNVSANRTTGTLSVRCRGEERYVRFEDGAVTGFSLGVGKGMPMLDHLRARGHVDKVGLDKVLQRGRRSRKPKTLQCVEAGLLDDALLCTAMVERVEEELFGLFDLREAEFSFEDGDAPARVFDSEQARVGVRLDIGAVLMEAARRRDENERIGKVVASDDDVLILLEGWDTVELAELAAEVAPLLDGRRSVADVTRELVGSPFHVRKAVFELVSAGVARPSTADELAEAADEMIGEGATEDAIRLMGRALAVARGDGVLRARYADLLEQAGRGADAAVEHALLGHDAVRSGDLEAARAAYDRALEASPDDLALREKRVELLEQCGTEDELVAAVLELVERHGVLGLAERARALLSAIVQRRRLERREDIVTAWARVESSLGHWREAAGHYRRLAEAVMPSDEVRGLELLRAALHEDPEDRELRDRLDAIESGRARRRRAFVRRSVAAAVCLSVLGAVGFVGVMEFKAARSAAFALADGLGDLRDGEGVQALATLHELDAGLGWTTTGRRAAAWSERLVNLQLEAVRAAIRGAEFDRARSICESLMEAVPRPDLAATCSALLRRTERERAAFGVLARVERQRDRPTSDDLGALAALASSEHLEFLLAHTAEVRDHEARAAMLAALGSIGSPRAHVTAARIALRARDDRTMLASREVLRGAAEHRRHGFEAEWAEVYPELERALDDPDRAPIAKDVLKLLRGDTSN